MIDQLHLHCPAVANDETLKSLVAAQLDLLKALKDLAQLNKDIVDGMNSFMDKAVKPPDER